MPKVRLQSLVLLLLFPALLAGCNRPHVIPVRPEVPVEPAPPVGVEPVKARPTTRDFDESLELPDDQFDLALSLLLFSQKYGGATAKQVEDGLALIDRWRERVKVAVDRRSSHEERIDTLRRFIHGELGFRFDAADPRGHSPDNLFMHRVMERRRGYCVTLSQLYVLLAPAVGIELKGCRVPGHFAVVDPRYPEGDIIESTDRGLPVSRTALYTKHRMSVQSVENHGVFLKPIPDKEVFSTLYSNLGALAAMANRTEEAERHFRKAVELAPANIEAKYNLSTVLAQRGTAESVQEALAEVNTALRMDPNFYRGYTRRAGIRGKYGDPEEAADDLRRAISLRPDLPQAYVEQGVIRYHSGDAKGAKESFVLALEKDERNVDALRNLAVVERELGNSGRADELEAAWRAALPKGASPDGLSGG